ncbi:hypothetical protein PPERSA_05950 [Pseudocohnilembus persalinus]|uniref:LITAF domain-containing protein n=1 Tax=Pseudocohnilembus persalinus TaxID=266149 RepID=A0A0V0R475_PSEPJ|nr:hypothetical protein PPERSA_05950 [Pseudocohnilembus persalinus]|eukprot:KRX09281.1 hypothetical protein PPERSA_05950 [Pseudocohnilembus persalinus]
MSQNQNYQHLQESQIENSTQRNNSEFNNTPQGNQNQQSIQMQEFQQNNSIELQNQQLAQSFIPQQQQFQPNNNQNIQMERPAIPNLQGQQMYQYVVPTEPNSRLSQTIFCAQCNKPVESEVNYKVGAGTVATSIAIALIGLTQGCCLIPCCVNECKDAVHNCKILQEKESLEEDKDKMGKPQQQQQIKKKAIKNGQSGLGALVALKQYNVYLFKEIEGESELLCITVEIPGTWKIQNLIQYSLEQFNEILFKKNQSFYLSDQIQNWAVCGAKKKNGYPKEEPNFAQDILVSDTGALKFSLLPYQSDSNCFIYEGNNQEQEQDQEVQQQEQEQQQQHFELNQKNKNQQQNPSLEKYNNSLVKKQKANQPKQEQPDYEEDTGGCLCFKKKSQKQSINDVDFAELTPDMINDALLEQNLDVILDQNFSFAWDFQHKNLNWPVEKNIKTICDPNRLLKERQVIAYFKEFVENISEFNYKSLEQTLERSFYRKIRKVMENLQKQGYDFQADGLRNKIESVELINITNIFGVGIGLNRRKNDGYDNFKVNDSYIMGNIPCRFYQKKRLDIKETARIIVQMEIAIMSAAQLKIIDKETKEDKLLDSIYKNVNKEAIHHMVLEAVLVECDYKQMKQIIESGQNFDIQNLQSYKSFMKSPQFQIIDFDNFMNGNDIARQRYDPAL